MAFTESLRLILDVDNRKGVQAVDQFTRSTTSGMDRAGSSMDRVGGTMTRVGAGMTAFGTVALLGLAQAGQSAAALEQAVGGTEAVFGAASGAIDEFAERSAESVGLSERAFRDLSTVAGAQLKNLGFSVEDAADKSIQLVEIGADLAATYGGTTAQAVEALGAAFRGEADPAERFGLRLNINTANAKAVALGLAESTSAVNDQARAQAVLALILEQSADAQGQFGRESDTAAGRQQRQAAAFEDLKAKIGEGFLPVMNAGVDVMSKMTGVLGGLNDATGGLVGQLAAYGAVGLVGVGVTSSLVGQVIKSRDALTGAWNAASGLSGRLGGLNRSFVTAGLAAGAFIVAVEAFDRLRPRVDANVGELESSLLGFAESGRLGGEAARVFGGDLGSLADAFERVAAPSTQSQLLDTLAGGPLRDSHWLQDANDRLNALDDTLTQLASRDPEAARAEFDAVAAGLVELGVPIERVEGELDGYRDAMASAETQSELTADATDDAAGAASGFQVELEGVGAATTVAAESIDGFNEALDELLGRFLDVDESIAAQNELVLGLAGHWAEMTEEFGTGGASLDINTEAGIRNRDMLRELIEASADTVTTMAEQGRTSEEIRGQWALDRAELQLVRDRFVAAGQDVAAYDALLAQIDEFVATNLAVNDAGTPVLTRFEQALNRLDGRRVSATVLAQIFETTARTTRGQHAFHEGGIVPGARGQEVGAVLLGQEEVLALDDPRHAANVARFMASSPTHSFATAPGGGGGGSVVYENHFHMEGAIISSEQDAVRWVSNAWNRGVEQNRVSIRGRRPS